MKKKEKKIPLHSRFAPVSFCGDAVMTKRGDVFRVMQITGVDPEPMEQHVVANICERFDAAIGTLNTDWRIYSYLLKRSSPALELHTAGEGVAGHRAAWLEQRRPALYSVELYLVILREREMAERTRSDVRALLSVQHDLEISRSRLQYDLDVLESAVGSVCIQLDDLFHPRRLDRRETLRFLRRLANTVPWKSEVHGTVEDYAVDEQMAYSGLDCWRRHMKQDEYYIRMCSMITEPAQTFPRMMRDLLAVPCDMTICTEWKPMSNEAARMAIDKKKSIFEWAKTQMRSYLPGVLFNNGPPQPQNVPVDGSQDKKIKMLDDALTEMERDGKRFGRFSLTVALLATEERELQPAAAALTGVFGTFDSKVIVETENQENAWRVMVPGTYDVVRRPPLWLLNTHYADLSLLFQPAEGQRRNEHLNAPALAILETPERTPFWLSTHVQDVGNAVFIGSTGSGKTFCLRTLAALYQQYRPFTVIYDMLGNYRRLAEQCGGSYMAIGKPGKVTINPFRLPPTKENLEFLFDFVRVLVQRNEYEMEPDQRKDLHQAILDLYEMDEPVQKLSTLARTCHHSYRARLDEWVGDGRLARYFDNVDDNLTLSRFQVFDFEGIDDRSDALEPLLFYITHRADVFIRDPANHHIPKLAIYDETWRFFQNPITRASIHAGLKTVRNRNGAIWMATQSGDDLRKSGLLETIAESCMTRVFLANPGMDENIYRDMFNLNNTQVGLIARLIPKRQLMVSWPGGSKVCNLFVDDESLKICGPEPKEKVAV
jgi:type IV secretion/conjugal transfer VirB4 family ATPase